MAALSAQPSGPSQLIDINGKSEVAPYLEHCTSVLHAAGRKCLHYQSLPGGVLNLAHCAPAAAGQGPVYSV